MDSKCTYGVQEGWRTCQRSGCPPRTRKRAAALRMYSPSRSTGTPKLLSSLCTARSEWRAGGSLVGRRLGCTARAVSCTSRCACFLLQSGTHKRRAPRALAHLQHKSKQSGIWQMFQWHLADVPTAANQRDICYAMYMRQPLPDMKRTPRFSTTMPSEAAKNASMWLMKCCSSSVSRTLSETQGTAQAAPDTAKWQEAQ